jgi:hypothetical protein
MTRTRKSLSLMRCVARTLSTNMALPKSYTAFPCEFPLAKGLTKGISGLPLDPARHLYLKAAHLGYSGRDRLPKHPKKNSV